ncbi:MAG: trehalose-phosphatase [Anaerolineae bacterium]|nr:trehalose-phosphatase [Anaerolineae bacterium]NIN99150.1 trehalose-phosphatase [Anaerolineae bacterium]NIQ81991.1 trehalose-phosphatase [Anaerolineae bacterium]
MDADQAIDYLLDAPPLALTTDFDGTMSEIAPSPEEAAIDPRCLASLAKLVSVLPLVAVVSGRQVEDVRRLVGLAGVVYLGNHGFEMYVNGATHVAPAASEHFLTVRRILEAARQQLDLPGLLFEDKVTSASIHYRLAADPSAARERVTLCLKALTEGTDMRVEQGRRVVELRPPVDADKGTALADLLARHDVASVVYAGDDTTDLDAFAGIRRWASATNHRALAVAVISREMPPRLRAEADLTVEGVGGWADFLDALLEAIIAEA